MVSYKDMNFKQLQAAAKAKGISLSIGGKTRTSDSLRRSLRAKKTVGKPKITGRKRPCKDLISYAPSYGYGSGSVDPLQQAAINLGLV